MADPAPPGDPFDPDEVDVDADDELASTSAEQALVAHHDAEVDTATALSRAASIARASPSPTHSNASGGGGGHTVNSQSVSYHTTNINIGSASPSSAGTALPELQALLAPGAAAVGGGVASFQSHALSTVQSLASSFGHIATVLQKDQAHAAREEQATRVRLSTLQGAVEALAAQNKELAHMVARAGDKATKQARELNEKVINLNNRLVVGLNAAGVSTAIPEFKSQQSSRPASSASATSGLNVASPSGSMIGESISSVIGAGFGMDASAIPTSSSSRNSGGVTDNHLIQILIDRVSRLEQEVTTQARRADTAQANLTSYFERLQAQTKANQTATIKLIEHAAAGGGNAPDAAITSALTPAARSQEARAMELVFSSIEVPSFEALEAQPFIAAQALHAVTTALPSSTGMISHMSTDLPSVLADLTAQFCASEAATQAMLELVLPAGDKRAAFDERRARLHQSIMESKQSLLGSLLAPSANALVGTTLAPAPRGPVRSAAAGKGKSSDRTTEQVRIDAAIEVAARAAVQAATTAARRKEPLLSAEALAATSAAAAAQLAAKEAQDVLASINFMKENGQFTLTAAVPAATVPTAEEAQRRAVDELFSDAPESSAARSMAGSLALKRVQDKARDQERQVLALDSTVQSMGNQLADLQRQATQGRDQAAKGLTGLSADFTSIMSQFAALSRQFQAQHKVLDGRLSQHRDETQQAVHHALDALQRVERGLERKADVALVLDKVGRGEYTQQMRKLKAVDDEILNRSVHREEYRLQLNELREVLSEDQRERVANIARIATELGKLVGDLEQKASKQDLLHMLQTLERMPKVHEEVEALKAYVAGQLETRTGEILEVAVDRKQLKRSMQRLLKSLQEEVATSALPVNCDACARRTGVHSGTNCLSCAQQMKLAGKLATYAGLGPATAMAHEVLASRGGGFMVTTASSSAAPSPSPPGTAYGRRPGTSGSSAPRTPQLQLQQGHGSAIRPTSSQTGRMSRTGPLPPAHGASYFAATAVADHFPVPNLGLTAPSTPVDNGLLSSPAAAPMSARSEVGSDGRVYSSRAHRTHRLVASGGGGPGKSRARLEEEAAEGLTLPPAEEHKDPMDSARRR